MKLLLFQASAFTSATSDFDPLPAATQRPRLVAFIHAEPADEEAAQRVVRKAVKQIKWLANKRDLRQVVLHSFAHLAERKAPVAVAERLIGQMAERLSNVGYVVDQTQFGLSLAWQLSVFQDSLAKVFVAIDGAAMDGAATDGAATDGATMDGAAIDAATIDGDQGR